MCVSQEKWKKRNKETTMLLSLNKSDGGFSHSVAVAVIQIRPKQPWQRRKNQTQNCNEEKRKENVTNEKKYLLIMNKMEWQSNWNDDFLFSFSIKIFLFVYDCFAMVFCCVFFLFNSIAVRNSNVDVQCSLCSTKQQSTCLIFVLLCSLHSSTNEISSNDL